VTEKNGVPEKRGKTQKRSSKICDIQIKRHWEGKGTLGSAKSCETGRRQRGVEEREKYKSPIGHFYKLETDLSNEHCGIL